MKAVAVVFALLEDISVRHNLKKIIILLYSVQECNLFLIELELYKKFISFID